MVPPQNQHADVELERFLWKIQEYRFVNSRFSLHAIDGQSETCSLAATGLTRNQGHDYMINHTPSDSIAQTLVSCNADCEAKYNALLQKYLALQSQHRSLKENLEFTIEEARRDRDFYMERYASLLNGKEVA